MVKGLSASMRNVGFGKFEPQRSYNYELFLTGVVIQQVIKIVGTDAEELCFSCIGCDIPVKTPEIVQCPWKNGVQHFPVRNLLQVHSFSTTHVENENLHLMRVFETWTGMMYDPLIGVGLPPVLLKATARVRFLDNTKQVKWEKQLLGIFPLSIQGHKGDASNATTLTPTITWSIDDIL